MATDCNESASVRVSNSEAGFPESREPSDEITEMEREFYRIFSSLDALAQGQHLSTVCQTLSQLKRDTEECLLSGCSSIMCTAFPVSARRALAELRFLMELKKCTSQLTIEELRTKFAELEKFLAYAEWDFKDSQAGLKNEVARLAGVYAMRVNQFVSQLTEQLSDEIREQFQMLGEADLSERSARMSTFVQARLQQLLGDWQSPFGESSIELFQHAATRFTRHGCELIAGIRQSARTLLGFSAQDGDWCTEFETSDCFTCIRDRAPDCFHSGMPLQFPTVHFRKHLLRRTLRSAHSDLLGYVSHAVEEHKCYLDKCRSDLTRRMAGQVNRAKDGVCAVIERALWESEYQGKSVSEEHLPEECRAILETLHQYSVELDLLLCRWDGVGDPGHEECLHV